MIKRRVSGINVIKPGLRVTIPGVEAIVDIILNYKTAVGNDFLIKKK